MFITSMELTEQQKHEISHSKVEIGVGRDSGDLGFRVNGVELGHIVGPDFEIHSGHNQGSHVTVNMFAEDFLIKGDAQLKVNLPDEVVAALIAAGWTAPTD